MSVAKNIANMLFRLPSEVRLVAVSKTRPAEDVAEAYRAGQRDFGENRPQEMAAKREALMATASGAASGTNDPGATCGGDSDIPDGGFADIRWHQIGHLQTNKVKLIAPFVSLIHSVDSSRLVAEISRQAERAGRVIDVLFEIRIAREQSKQGWDWGELVWWLETGEYRNFPDVGFRGVMGVATNTDDEAVLRSEFRRLAQMHAELRERFFENGDVNPASDAASLSGSGSPSCFGGGRFDIISMGMSSDYRIAVECGSTMVRIGSAIFGERWYK